MNSKAEDATNKIMLAFDSGGIVLLDLHQYALIDAHVRSILNRARENKAEKNNASGQAFSGQWQNVNETHDAAGVYAP